jgi:hypothetical protein
MSNAPLPSSFDGNTYGHLFEELYLKKSLRWSYSDFYEENRWEKFSRRLREEPLIPLGT